MNHFRQEIFEEVAKSNLSGLIFTYIWAFDLKTDWDYVQKVCDIFERKGAEVCLVELEKEFDIRKERNKHPHRLSHKPTKRDVVRSERDPRGTFNDHRMNSREGEIKRKEYIKISNTKLKSEEVAKIIKNKFDL